MRDKKYASWDDQLQFMSEKGYRLLAPDEVITDKCVYKTALDIQVAYSNIGKRAAEVNFPYFAMKTYEPKIEPQVVANETPPDKRFLLCARLLHLI